MCRELSIKGYSMGNRMATEVEGTLGSDEEDMEYDLMQTSVIGKMETEKARLCRLV